MNHEAHISYTDMDALPEIPKDFASQAYQFQELMMMYSCAIREVRTKLEVLNDELSIRHKRNPIKHITSRIKRPLSIIQKLKRYEAPLRTCFFARMTSPSSARRTIFRIPRPTATAACI